MKKQTRTVFRLISIWLLMLLVCACAKNAPQQEAVTFAPHVNSYAYTLEGLSAPLRILVVCDLHIAAPDDPQWNDDEKETCQARIAAFSGAHGTTADYWEMLAPLLDDYDADVILFAGDMVDYASEESLALLAGGLAQIDTPFLYVRADHDTEPFYVDDALTAEQTHAMQEALCDMSDTQLFEINGLRIATLQNSTSQMTTSQLSFLQSLAEDPVSPVLLLTHVPLHPLDDEAFRAQANEAWNGAYYVWGQGADSYYEADAVTAEGLSLIYEQKIPVRFVFAGHLHFAYEGELTTDCTQIVFAPAFSDNIALIELSPP